MELFFYVLSRRVQIHRTFYAKGVLYGQGVPIENIVIHYGPEFSDYTSFDEMKAAFLDAYPDAECLDISTFWLGCIWGTLACIERFLLSEHAYCYFVQDDFVPVDSVADILSDFDKLRVHDPNFRLCLYNFPHKPGAEIPHPSEQIREELDIYQGLYQFGDHGIILDKQGASYMVENMKRIGGAAESVLKKAIGTSEGDSFYIRGETDYMKNYMPEKWSAMDPSKDLKSFSPGRIGDHAH